MKEDPRSLQRIAHLARIELTAEEERVFAPQFDKILGYVAKLNTLDTGQVEPTFNVISLKNVLRDDTPRLSDSASQIVQNFPQKEGNFCKVPQVIE